MEKSSLLNLGSLLDQIAQQITGDSIDFPSHFNFTWHNIQFAGQIFRSRIKAHYSINLVANLGFIPFSAENKLRRKKLLKIFTPLFARGDYSLAPNSQIQMILLTDFAGPVSARRLVEVITYTLLDLKEDLKSIQKSVIDPKVSHRLRPTTPQFPA